MAEPKPGQPLDPEAERILGGDYEEEEDSGSRPSIHSAEPIGDTGLTKIAFDEGYVRDVLEEAFAWLAEKFESDHWALTERQSRMLGAPTTQLLGSVWMHIQRMLPAFLERWANSTPGLMDFAMAAGLVVGPKVARQFAISRERRNNPQPRRPAPAGARPAASQPRPVQAVGAIEEIQVFTMEEDDAA